MEIEGSDGVFLTGEDLAIFNNDDFSSDSVRDFDGEIDGGAFWNFAADHGVVDTVTIAIGGELKSGSLRMVCDVNTACADSIEDALLSSIVGEDTSRWITWEVEHVAITATCGRNTNAVVEVVFPKLHGLLSLMDAEAGGVIEGCAVGAPSCGERGGGVDRLALSQFNVLAKSPECVPDFNGVEVLDIEDPGTLPCWVIDNEDTALAVSVVNRCLSLSVPGIRAEGAIDFWDLSGDPNAVRVGSRAPFFATDFKGARGCSGEFNMTGDRSMIGQAPEIETLKVGEADTFLDIITELLASVVAVRRGVTVKVSAEPGACGE